MSAPAVINFGPAILVDRDRTAVLHATGVAAHLEV
jgi:hypothetical protein